MKKIIAGGIAAAAIAVIPGVALAAPAFADPHGLQPQQLQNVLDNLAVQGPQNPTQDAAQGQQGPNVARLFNISVLAEGPNTSSQLVELDGPANHVFNGGHTPVGAKGPGVFQFSTVPGGLPGIVRAKWNFLDANNQVTDSVSMDMVVVQLPGQPPKLDLQNIRTGNTVATSGTKIDGTGDVFDDFTQGP